jgi:hypothetical protein
VNPGGSSRSCCRTLQPFCHPSPCQVSVSSILAWQVWQCCEEEPLPGNPETTDCFQPCRALPSHVAGSDPKEVAALTASGQLPYCCPPCRIGKLSLHPRVLRCLYAPMRTFFPTSPCLCMRLPLSCCLSRSAWLPSSHLSKGHQQCAHHAGSSARRLHCPTPQCLPVRRSSCGTRPSSPTPTPAAPSSQHTQAREGPREGGAGRAACPSPAQPPLCCRNDLASPGGGGGAGGFTAFMLLLTTSCRAVHCASRCRPSHRGVSYQEKGGKRAAHGAADAPAAQRQSGEPVPCVGARTT